MNIPQQSLKAMYYKKTKNYNSQIILLLCLLVIPFLSWYRFKPNPGQVGDSFSLLIALCIVVFSLVRMDNWFRVTPALIGGGGVIIPTIISLPENTYVGPAIIAISSLLLFISLANTITILPSKIILSTLSWGLSIGAFIQIVIGFFQVTGLAADWKLPFMIYEPSGKTQLMGNLSQRNLFGNYVFLGLLSICWLYANNRLKGSILIVLASLFALFLAWSSSRTVLLYGVGVSFLVGILYFLSKRDLEVVRMAGALSLSIFLLAIFQINIESINGLINNLSATTIEQKSAISRFSDAGLGSLRFNEWEKAWLIFLENPVFGVGLGQYGAAAYDLEAISGSQGMSMFFTHSHNLVLQLLTETGAIGTVGVAIALLWAFLPWFKKENLNVDAFLVLGLAMVILIHSMLELPLWAGSFLMIFGVIMGLSPAKLIRFDFSKRIRVVIFVLFFVAFLWQTLTGLIMYKSWVQWYSPSRNMEENELRVEHFLTQRKNIIWAYDVDLILTNYMGFSEAYTSIQKPLFEQLVEYRPYPRLTVRLAILQYRSGDIGGAKSTFEKAYKVFPEKINEWMLSALPDDDKEILEELKKKSASF